MKRFNVYFPLIILVAIAVLPACKAKKAVVDQPYHRTETYPADPVSHTPPPPPPAPVKQTPPPPPPAAPEKPDYNFSNIQFEFNSGILKTDAYPVLDKAAAAMKANTSIKFVLNGYASAEGTPDHNMELSIQRANSVKLYLVNSGVPGANLTAKGLGESNPVADNSTEEGRILNRRVEIKLQ
jgi:OOP family OmpA-OmpF porin